MEPGITRFAQVSAKYNINAYDKPVYDLLYIQKISIKTNLFIMLQSYAGQTANKLYKVQTGRA